MLSIFTFFFEGRGFKNNVLALNTGNHENYSTQAAVINVDGEFWNDVAVKYFIKRV